jgi:hypothetical protein
MKDNEKVKQLELEIENLEEKKNGNIQAFLDLVKKGMISQDDKTYLDNNVKIDNKIEEHRKTIEKLLKEEQELEAQIQIIPKE